MPLIKQPMHYIDEDAALNAVCEKWMQAKVLAVDTEFMRTDTYYPKPALLQVNDGDANYLIDPVAIQDLSALKAVMDAPNIRICMHACSEDIEVFHRLFNSVPSGIFDTQIAAAFVGYGYSVGYANLVKAMLEIELPKDATRSDWLQRPLTPVQKEYAALDVEYLWVIYHALEQALTDKGRLPWILEACAEQTEQALNAQNAELAAQRIKSAWRLTPEAQAHLKALSIWREQAAQRANRPRNHIIKEKSLYKIAEQVPTTLDDFRGIEDLSEKGIKKHGDAMLRVLASVNTDNPDVLFVRPPSTSPQKKLIQALKQVVGQVAEEHGVASEWLARRKEYEAVALRITNGEAPDKVLAEVFYHSWQKQILVDKLVAVV